MDIEAFFAQKVVFITGVSGFVGKAILEKLLRGCPDLAKVYVLIRSKRGKSGEERLQDILHTVRVREENRASLDKVFLINGDVTFNDLGINSEDSAKLINEVSIVIHSAANVNFSASLKMALKVNLEGTRNMLEFAKTIKCLKAFVYISTIYSNSDRSDIGEKIYPAKIEPHVAMNLYSDFPPDFADSLVPRIKENHILIYAFSKKMAENLIQEYRFDLPLCIVRPSIVTTAYREPFPGWIDNFMGYNGLVTAVSRGALRVMVANKSGVVDLIPIDHVVNLTLAAAMSLGVEEHKREDVLVYNGSSSGNPFGFFQLGKQIVEASKSYPPNGLIWYPSLTILSNPKNFLILDFFYHYIPTLVAQGVLIVLGKRPKTSVLALYRKWKTLSKMTYGIGRVKYSISTDNTKALFKKLSSKDQEAFHFDISTINKENFIEDGLHGFRRFAAGEDDADLPAARNNLKRYRWFYVASCICWALFGVAIFKILSNFL